MVPYRSEVTSHVARCKVSVSLPPKCADLLSGMHLVERNAASGSYPQFATNPKPLQSADDQAHIAGERFLVRGIDSPCIAQ